MPEELRSQASDVRLALAEACCRMPGEAAERLASIPRRSPYADWRLLVRGMLSWNDDKLSEAQEVWSRLDTDRRPWRIAAALVLAHREDLTELKLNKTSVDANSDIWLSNYDETILLHAKLTRQSQIDRVALRAARGVMRVVSTVRDATVSPDHIRWLEDFTRNYESIEPDLVQAMHETMIARAQHGQYVDIFEDCTEKFRGPRHDRNNTLAKFNFFLDEDFKVAKQYLDAYMNTDLPRNGEISTALKQAITSQLHLYLGSLMCVREQSSGLPLHFAFNPKINDYIIQQFENAIETCPFNRFAYDCLEARLQVLLTEGDFDKGTRDEVEDEISQLWERRLKHLPDDLPTRLRLVDYLLENEKSDRAQEHIGLLTGLQGSDPLAASIHWKWNLLESMRLARRKTSLTKSAVHLDEAEKLWPKWLSVAWLHYLRAAHQVRSGSSTAFEQMPEQLRCPSKVTEACMQLGAAQRMSVPAAEIKMLRNKVDAFAAPGNSLAWNDLISVASFFWDLHRTNLKYTAYRMHAGKFLARLHGQFLARPSLMLDDLDNPSVRAALFILAREGYFGNTYTLAVPHCLHTRRVADHPVVAATTTLALIKLTSRFESRRFLRYVKVLENAGQKESDPYYRHFYLSLSETLSGRAEFDDFKFYELEPNSIEQKFFEVVDDSAVIDS